MKLNIYSFLSFLIIVTIISPACGTGNGEEKGDPQNTEFPIPWPDGGEIITDEREGPTGFITIRYDEDQYETVVDFYDDYASGSGWNRSETGQGEVPTINYMNLAAGQNISVDPPNDQVSEAFIVTLTVS